MTVDKVHCVLLHGLPGSGKSTLLRIVRELPEWTVISCGDLIREEIASSSPLGTLWRSYLERGDLLPDEEITAYFFSKLSRMSGAPSIMIDGFPRTPAQATVFLSKAGILGLDVLRVVELSVPPDVAMSRLRDRRVCSTCGCVYNLRTDPPRVDGICDKDGAVLTTRSNEPLEILERRMEVYGNAFHKLSNFYIEQCVPISTIDAGRTIAEVKSLALNLLSN